ncbi:hypothetical protein PDE_04143 [Penicillium oxalicum 114-2]|uniref:Uncharacterized protein n=1 Tax=Penicillium oxalicum (strain 114-2 / CGMCC 5302) TaxID=933388 RepID=S7ZFZ6_PENO1|nr:hypothetical protein PDE_04143 [Penicillium oxalicum 114-2]
MFASHSVGKVSLRSDDSDENLVGTKSHTARLHWCLINEVSEKQSMHYRPGRLSSIPVQSASMIILENQVSQSDTSYNTHSDEWREFWRLRELFYRSSFLSHSQEEIRSWSRRAPHAAFPFRSGPHRRADTQFVAVQSEPSLCFKIRDSRLTTGAVLAFGAELHSSISAPSAALEAPCSGSGWSWHCWTISMRAVPGKVSQWAYTKHSGEDRAFSP